MKTKIPIVGAVLLGLLCLGNSECGGNNEDGQEYGRFISDKELCKFQYSISNINDVTDTLGPPDGEPVTIQGIKMVQYLYTKKEDNTIRSAITQFMFRDDILGLVRRMGNKIRVGSPPSCLGIPTISKRDLRPDGGQLITDEELCNFRYGVTAREEVIAALGEPTTSTSTVTGSSIDYTYLNDDDREASETISFSFNEEDILESVEYLGVRDRSIPDCLNN
jgi:hypothetical protein